MRAILFSVLLVTSSVQVFSQTERSEGDDGIAVVLRVVGSVEIGGVNAIWQKAERGFSLSSGTKLRTGRVSSCLLRFDDGSVIRIEASSEVEIRGQWRASVLDERELQVDFGKIAFAVKKVETSHSDLNQQPQSLQSKARKEHLMSMTKKPSSPSSQAVDKPTLPTTSINKPNR